MNNFSFFWNTIASLKTILLLFLSFLSFCIYGIEGENDAAKYMAKAGSFVNVFQKDSVLFYLDKAHEILVREKDNNLYPILCNRLSVLYRQLGHPKRSIQFSKEAIKYYSEGDSNRLAHFYLSLSNGYRAMENIDSFSIILKKVLLLNKECKDSLITVIAAANLGYLHYKKGDTINNREFLLKALNLAMDNPRLQGHIPWIALILGKVEESSNSSNKALEYYYQGLETVSIENLSMRTLLHKRIAQIYEGKNLFDSAYFHQKTSSNLNVLFLSKNKPKDLLKIEKQFETRLKENQILKLKNQKLESDISTKNLKLVLLSLSVLLILIIFGFVYFKNRSKSRQDKARQEIEFLRNQNKLLALESLIQGEENERKRIAQELHDSIGASLSCIQLLLNKVENKTVREAKQMLGDCIDETRNISRNLTPQVLKNYGLKEAINLLCLRASDVRNIEVHENLNVLSVLQLDYIKELHIYRILEECFANSIKHSQAKNIYINANQSGKILSLSFEDDGKGFNTFQVQSGMGLQNFKNRIKALNGTIHLESSINNGFLLIFKIPID